MPLFVPKDRKSLLRQFLNGLYDAVVITDPHGHVIELNARAEEFFGRTQEDLLDQPLGVLIPGLTSAIIERIRRGLDEDRHVMVDANGRDAKGSRFACEVTISTLELDTPDNLVFTIRNVERRRKINEALRAKEGAFELAPVALFACSSDGCVQHANAAFCELFGLGDEAEARAHVFGDFMGDAPLPENFGKALAGEETTARVAASSESGAAEVEVVLAPWRVGRKVRGVVGSVVKV